MRTVAMLPISANQRLLTVEVGSGDERQWLVLGVTPAGIHTLHTMAPQACPPAAASAQARSHSCWPGTCRRQCQEQRRGSDAR